MAIYEINGARYEIDDTNLTKQQLDAAIEEIAAQPRDSALDYSFDVAAQMGYKGIEAFGDALQGFGFDTVGSALQGFGARGVAQQEEDIARGGFQEQYPGSFFEQDSIGDAAGWILEGMQKNAASGGFALAGTAATAVAALASAPAAAILGATTYAGSFLMGTGESALEQEEKTGNYDSSVALGTGALIGFLDKFGAGRVFSPSQLGKMSVKELYEKLAQKGYTQAAQEVAKEIGKKAVTEGITEATQEAAIMGSAASQGGQYTAGEVGNRLVDAAVLGTGFGGTAATGQAAVQGAAQATGFAKSSTQRQADALSNAAASMLERGMDTGDQVMIDKANEAGFAIEAAKNGDLAPLQKLAVEEQENNDPSELAKASFAQRLQGIIDDESASDQPFDVENIDVNDAQSARGIVDAAHGQIKEGIKTLKAILKEGGTLSDGTQYAGLNPRNAQTFDELMERVEAMVGVEMAKNKVKKTITEKQIRKIKELVGDTQEGQQLVNLIRESVVLTDLHNQGYQGGISKFTDKLNPFAPTGSYNTSALVQASVRAGVTGAVAAGTGGTSLAIQLPIVGFGRLYDAVTGERSTVSSFIRDNKDGEALPKPTPPSIIDEQAAAEQRDQNLAAGVQAYLDEASETTGGAELAAIETVTAQLGIPAAREDYAQAIDELIAREKALNNADMVEAYTQAKNRKAREQNPQSIQIAITTRMKENLRARADEARAQQQRANEAIIAMERNQRIEQGKADNRAAVQGLLDQLNADNVINKGHKAQLQSALAGTFLLDLGRNPMATVENTIKDLLDNGVPQEAIDTYIMPYAQRVARQQDARPQEFTDEARVIPVPQGNIGMQEMFGVDEVLPGGNFIDLDTRADLTGQTFSGGSVVIQDGKPMLETNDQRAEPATKADGRKVKVNLFKQKAGWKWIDVPNGAPTIVSTETGGKHIYSLSTRFNTPVTLQTYPTQPSEPRLRPTSQGEAVLGNRIGSISVRGKVHPVYDQVTIESKQGTREFTEESSTIAPPTFKGKTPTVAGQSTPGTGNKHQLAPHLRIEVAPQREGKPLFTQKTNNKNADVQIDAIDEVIARHPNATSSPEAWGYMMSDALANGDVPAPPYKLIKDLNDGTSAALIGSLTPGQIADADHGFDNARFFREMYTSGQVPIEATGKLFLWSFLSRGVSPYVQEGMFLDAYDGISEWIEAAAEGSLRQRLPAYKKWAKTAAPKGSGQPGAGSTHNLNAFGETFLIKMSQDAGLGDGRSRLQVIHDMMSDPNTTGQQVRRQFLRMGEGVGIDNKVVSFTLLVAGYDDVMVIDRVQLRNMWNDGRFEGINLWDGYKVDGKPVTGSELSKITYGARGLLVYEAAEKAIAARIDDIYAAAGRPGVGSVGRYHWETWVASSQQEASHATIDAILEDIKGTSAPLLGVTSKEGEYGSYAYGAQYGVEDAGSYFLYTVPGRGTYKFSVDNFVTFLNEIKKARNGVVPRLFKVTESGNAPWFTREGVSIDALNEEATKYGRRIKNEGDERDVSETIAGQDVPDRSPANLSDASEQQELPGILSEPQGSSQPAQPVQEAVVPTTRQIAAQEDNAKPLFEVGKRGGEFENGINKTEDLQRLAKALGIVVKTFQSMAAMNRHRGYKGNPNRTTMGVATISDRGVLPPRIAIMEAGFPRRRRGSNLPVQSREEFITTFAHEIAHIIEAMSMNTATPELAVKGYAPTVRRSPIATDQYWVNSGSFREALLDLVRYAHGDGDKYALPEGWTREDAQLVEEEIKFLQDFGMVHIDIGGGASTTTFVRAPFGADPEAFVEASMEKYREARAKLIEEGVDPNKIVSASEYAAEARRRATEARDSYVRNPAEFAVDPIWTYIVDPSFARDAMPKTTEFIRKLLNNSGFSKNTIKFYSSPMATIIAVALAVLAANGGEEPEEQPMTPGALSPQGQGALSII